MPKSEMQIEADREQSVADALDAIGYPLQVFRHYDESNYTYQRRLVEFIKRLVPYAAVLNAEFTVVRDCRDPREKTHQPILSSKTEQNHV